MTKDEALAFDLALEALKSCSGVPHWPALQPAITAIKKVRALDKMAENARELGLDYEPVAPVQEDWGPGPHECHSLTASVQEPVAWMFQHEETGRTMCVDAQQVKWGFEKSNPRLKKIAPLYTTPPAGEKK